MAAPKVACVTSFLDCLADQRLERARYDRIEKQLCEVLGATDAIDLEGKILAAMSNPRHSSLTLIHLLSQHAVILDAANAKFEAAEALQRLRVKHQQLHLDQDLFQIDC